MTVSSILKPLVIFLTLSVDINDNTYDEERKKNNCSKRPYGIIINKGTPAVLRCNGKGRLINDCLSRPGSNMRNFLVENPDNNRVLTTTYTYGNLLEHDTLSG